MAVRGIAGVLALGFLFAPGVRAQSAKSYTIFRSTKIYSSVGNRTQETRQLEASREDGSYVLQFFDDQGYWSTITLPREKLIVQVDPKYHNKVTWPLHPEMIERREKRFDPADRCAQAIGTTAKFLGTATIADIPVAIYGVRYDARFGRYLDTQSLAPSLNCARLRREEAQLDGSGKPVKTITEEAVLVKKGEPAAALFEIPSDAKEVLPSKMRMDRYMGSNNQEMRQQILIDTAEMDKRYKAERAKLK